MSTKELMDELSSEYPYFSDFKKADPKFYQRSIYETLRINTKKDFHFNKQLGKWSVFESELEISKEPKTIAIPLIDRTSISQIQSVGPAFEEVNITENVNIEAEVIPQTISVNMEVIDLEEQQTTQEDEVSTTQPNAESTATQDNQVLYVRSRSSEVIIIDDCEDDDQSQGDVIIKNQDDDEEVTVEFFSQYKTVITDALMSLSIKAGSLEEIFKVISDNEDTKHISFNSISDFLHIRGEKEGFYKVIASKNLVLWSNLDLPFTTLIKKYMILFEGVLDVIKIGSSEEICNYLILNQVNISPKTVRKILDSYGTEYLQFHRLGERVIFKRRDASQLNLNNSFNLKN